MTISRTNRDDTMPMCVALAATHKDSFLDTGDTRVDRFERFCLLLWIGIAIMMLIQAPLAPAGVLRLGEPFNYADGDLDGRGTDDSFGDFSNWGDDFQFNGSQWTSDWTTDLDSSLDFSVSSNVLSLAVGPATLEDHSGSVSRGFALDHRRTTWTFAGIVTLAGDTGEDYSTTMNFAGEHAGDTARMGMKNGQFVMQFGDQPEISAGLVHSNTPYTLVARVEFGVPVTVGGTPQTGERMSVWVNETYRRLNEGLATPLMSVESATGMTDLGNLFGISARLSSDFANRLIWDDLFIGTDYQDVNGFRHDISPQGAQLQDGFFSWDVASDGLVKMYPFADTGFGDVTMTIGGNNVVALDGGNAGGIADALKRDGVQADGELTLTLEGLDPGNPPEGDPYILKTYHHHPQTQLSPIDIYLNVDGQEEFVMSLNPSTGDELAAHASIAFSALDRYAVFRFVSQDGGPVWLNGFELVPEPNSSVMILLALAGLAGCRRGRPISD